MVVSASAALGIAEYAPGNIVDVGGRKLQVNRFLFRGGTEDDPRQNAETYRFCPQCTYATDRHLARECPQCHEPLLTGLYVDYEAARGREREFITQEDEFRERVDVTCSSSPTMMWLARPSLWWRPYRRCWHSMRPRPRRRDS